MDVARASLARQRARSLNIGTVVFALLRLLRLTNSIPTALLVLLGAHLIGAPLAQPRLWLAMGAMWFVTAFGYLSNDLADLAEDEINKPDRPLPSGVVSLPTARGLGALLVGGALLLSGRLGALPLLVAGMVLLLLLLYNWKLKAMPAIGNGLIAVLAAAALLTGAVAIYGLQWQVLRQLLSPMLPLALFITAREMIKTLEDREGDWQAGKATVATVWGSQGTQRVLWLLAVLLLLSSVAPVLLAGYSFHYLLVILVGVNLPLWYTLYQLALDDAPANVSHTLVLLKLSYLAGLLALWLA
ncbi:MAG: UbiA family prenyltransferase [Caldilineaceae bacterium]